MEEVQLSKEEFDNIPSMVSSGEERTIAVDGLLVKKKSIDDWYLLSYSKDGDLFKIETKKIVIK